jgi:hypothetical protein
VRPLGHTLTVREGPLTLALEGGWFVPVFSGRTSGDWERNAGKIEARLAEEGYHLPGPEDRGPQAFVGFVWTGGTGTATVRFVWTGGTGTATVRFERTGESLAFANHMVRWLGGERARFAPIAAHEAPFETRVETAFVVGVDPRLQGMLYPEIASDDVDAMFEVLVLSEGDEGEVAARKAARAFEARELVHASLPDPTLGSRVAWDRLLVARHGADRGQHFVVGMQTADRYGRVIRPSSPRAPADTWLTVVRDDSGAWGGARRWEVAALGVTGNGVPVHDVLTGVHFPAPGDDPTEARRPYARVEPVRADAKVWVQPHPTGVGLLAETRTTLQVTAVGGLVPWFDVWLPRHELLEDSWRITRAKTEDGAELLGATPLLSRFEQGRKAPRPDPGEDEDKVTDTPIDDADEEETQRAPGDALLDEARTRNLVRVLLPEPVQPGETVTFDLWWEDTWPWANWSRCSIETRGWGKASGLQSFLPTLPTAPPGGEWRYTLRTHVPKETRLVPAASGRTTAEGEKDDWMWVQSESLDQPGLFPRVSVGKWYTHTEPGVRGLPAVRAHLLALNSGSAHTFPPEVRRVAGFFQGFLPNYPVREIEVIENPARCGGFVWVAPHGMAALQQMVTTRQTGGPENERPHFENATFAHELAHQYWGHLVPPASIDDFWIAETFAETYACMYLSPAFEPASCERIMAVARREWEQPLRWRDAPLVSAYRRAHQPGIVYQYGPYVFHRMLRTRIGDQAYFQALDLLAIQHPHQRATTERLQHYFTMTSGQDLSDFFDFWVYSGHVPALDAVWTAKKGTVEISMTANVPFGHFVVPVRVDRADGDPVWGTVDVRDGEGTLSLPVPGKVREVVVDPHGVTLATARRSRKG